MRIDYYSPLASDYTSGEVFLRQYNETETEIVFHSGTFSFKKDGDYEDDLICQWRVRPKQPMYPQSFLNGLQALRNAWIDIVQAIDDYNDIELGAVMAKNYPFDESFDDMFPAVKAWTEGMLPQEMK